MKQKLLLTTKRLYKLKTSGNCSRSVSIPAVGLLCLCFGLAVSSRPVWAQSASETDASVDLGETDVTGGEESASGEVVASTGEEQETSETVAPKAPEAPAPPAGASLNSCGHTPKKSPPKVNFRATNTLISEYVGNNGGNNEGQHGDDDDFWAFRNDLYIQASNRTLDSAIVLSGAMFHNPPARVPYEEWTNPEVMWDEDVSQGYTLLNYSNDYRVERLHGTVNIDKLKITGGDFYVNFGRGMALSLIKQPDIGVHNTLRGGRLEYRIPRRFKGIVVGGVVNGRNIDGLTKQIHEDDPLARIAGARFEFEVGDSATVGAHGVLMRPRFTDENQIADDRLWVDQSPGVSVSSAGATGELNLEKLHIYVEGNAQVHDDYRPPEGKDIEGEPGYAAYGEISYDLSPFNLKLEGIYYHRWLMEGQKRGSAPQAQFLTLAMAYHHLVTLETKWMVIKSLGNAKGGKLSGDVYIKDTNTQLTLSNALIKYEGGLKPNGAWTDHGDTLIIHPILRAHQIFGDTGLQVILDGGYRYEIETAGEERTGQLWHITADFTAAISGPHSIEIKSEIRRHELEITEDNDYWITLTTVGYELSGLFGLSISHEFSDQLGGIIGKIGDWELPWPKQHYFFLMGSFHTPKPLEALSFRMFAGAQRGGFKCIGGVCRVYPDTVGAWVEAVYRF